MCIKGVGNANVMCMMFKILLGLDLAEAWWSAANRQSLRRSIAWSFTTRIQRIRGEH